MLYRLAVLLGLLALLLDAAEANGLRSLVAEDANVPTNDEVAQWAAKVLLGAAKARTDNDRKETKAYIDKLEAEYKPNEDAAFVSAREAHAKKQVQTTSTTPNPRSKDLHYGSFVKRHRPNGDCSGTPNLITAHKFDGYCVDDGFGYSHDFSCAHVNEEGIVSLNRNSYYGSGPCQGEPFYSYSSGWSGLKCKMDSAYSTGVSMPQTISHQCSKKDISDFVHDGGIVTFAYGYDSSCNAPVETVSIQPFNGCELMTEYRDAQGNRVQYYDPNGSASYKFGSIKGCAPNGKMSVVVYSDPACTRPLTKGTATPDGTDMCHYDISLFGYTRTMCVPTGGM